MRFRFSLTGHSIADPHFHKDDVQKAFRASDAQFLGRGTFGDTWAVSTRSGKTAVKIIYNPSFPEIRLDREIEALNRGADCDSIAKLLQSGRILIEDKLYPFLEFEYIPGGNLLGHLQSGNWPNMEQLRSFCYNILRAIALLHSKRVLHRDIKLENIVLRNGLYERPVLLDLGVARILDLPSLTAYPQPVGTAPYMAPEQIRGERAKKASDIWALGIVLYICATGRHPFYDQTELSEKEAIDRILLGAPRLPTTVPDDIASLIYRFLSPECYERGSAERALAEMEV